jgi:uncharacterized protein
MRLSRILLAVGVSSSLLLGAGIGVARYAVLGGGRRRLAVLGTRSADTVRLPRVNATVLPMTFGLQTDDGRLHIVGSTVRLTPDFVEREIAPALPRKAERVRLVGNVFGPDSALTQSGILASYVASGMAHSLWDFTPDEEAHAGTWFVHVHGLGASPASTLRSVDAARRLGFPSTIVSLEGSPDMERRGSGIRKVHVPRVLAAVDHARENGAVRVILVGWSYGGQLSLQAAAARPEVAGVVLISPMIDFLTALRASARMRRVPAFLAELGVGVLSTPCLSWLAGVDRALRRLPLNVEETVQLPALLMHSRGDESLPFDLVQEFHHHSGGRTSFAEFPPAPHTMEWNSDPEMFTDEIDRWLRSIGQEATDG